MSILKRLRPAGAEQKEEYPEIVYLREILNDMDRNGRLDDVDTRVSQGMGALLTLVLAMAGFDEEDMPKIADKMLESMESYDAESFD